MSDKSEKKKKKRVGSVIFRIVLIIIAGLTVGIGVFTWNASGLVGNQLPMPFGIGVSVVMSPSMEPVLHTNDLVFVTAKDSYDVGDIIVYQEGKMLVIHRIVSIDGEKVVTKGDANNAPDDPISLSDVKAALSFSIPFIGVIFKYLKTVPGTLLVLAVAIFLLYRSRQKERDKDREELEDIVEEIRRLRSLQNASDTSEAANEESAASESGTDEVKGDTSDSSEAAGEDAAKAESEESADVEDVEEEASADAEGSEQHESAEPADADTDEEQELSEPAADAETDVSEFSESSDGSDTEKDDPVESAEIADAADQESTESDDQ